VLAASPYSCVQSAAPGDRVDKDGTLWLEYPKKGGSSPAVAVTATGANRKMFLRHSSQVKGDHPWVTASGIEGTEKVTVSLGKKPAKATKYTVRLYFLEPNKTTTGKRVFNVALQGKPVLENLDVYKQAGGTNRGIVREFKGVAIDGTLSVTLKATVGLPVISGVEVVAER
jgi:hypothetical protein